MKDAVRPSAPSFIPAPRVAARGAAYSTTGANLMVAIGGVWLAAYVYARFFGEGMRGGLRPAPLRRAPGAVADGGPHQ